MDVDNKVIYYLYRRYMLLRYNKFHFLYVMLVLEFYEKGL